MDYAGQGIIQSGLEHIDVIPMNGKPSFISFVFGKDSVPIFVQKGEFETFCIGLRKDGYVNRIRIETAILVRHAPGRTNRYGSGGLSADGSPKRSVASGQFVIVRPDGSRNGLSRIGFNPDSRYIGILECNPD